MADDKMVTVPKWALEHILEWADFNDGGPGYPSAKMSEARAEIENAVKEAE